MTEQYNACFVRTIVVLHVVRRESAKADETLMEPSIATFMPTHVHSPSTPSRKNLYIISILALHACQLLAQDATSDV